MSRLNLIGLMAVMLSAFYLVHTQYESRRLYTQLDRAHAQAKRLLDPGLTLRNNLWDSYLGMI